MPWDPTQYLKFAEPRLRPAIDLLARIRIADPVTVCDLGCGTGTVTRLLAERWPAAAVTGIDSSAAMLAQAAAVDSRITWQRASVAEWRPALTVDLIFSNAALHWLPDHATLFPRLMAALAPGGTLAVQMPRNFAAPSHTLIADVVRTGPWRAQLEPLLAAAPVGVPAAYFRMLAPFAAHIDVWETEYLQILQGPDPVKEWVKGTWLRQFLDALPEVQRPAFERAYAERARAAYPAEADGATLFPFRRLFIIARL